MILQAVSWRPSKFLLGIAFSLAVICLPLQAQELQPGGPTPGGPEPRQLQMRLQAQRGGAEADAPGQDLVRLLSLPEVRRALALTEEQQKKLEEIAFSTRKASIQQHATLEVQRLELQRLIEADNPDRPAIEKKITEIAQAQAALMRTQVNGMVDARSTLTREQLQRVRDYVQRQVRQRIQQGGQRAAGPGLNLPPPPSPPAPPPPPSPR